MIDPNRGTGRTTRQMQAAPIDAVFISCKHAALTHDKHLAQKHERRDLKIVSSSWLTNGGWHGMLFSGIVLDHDLHLTAGERHHLDAAITRVRRTT